MLRNAVVDAAARDGGGIWAAVHAVPVPLTMNPCASAENEPTATHSVVSGQVTAESIAPGTVALAGSGDLVAVQELPCPVTSMPCLFPASSR